MWLRASLLLLAVLLLLPLALLAHVLFQPRDMMVMIFRKRLEELGCTGVPVSIEEVTIKRWSFELRGLRIGNVRGEWKVPYSLHMDRLYISVGSFLAFLSLHPGTHPHLLRFSSLEFTLGFRIKQIEKVEFEGVKIFIDDDPGPLKPPHTLMRGQLKKRPINGGLGVRRREFELEPTRLRWYEPGSKSKPKGTIRIFASSTVEADSDGEDAFPFELISGADRLRMYAASKEERDEWVRSIEQAIADVPHALSSGGVENNAPWMAAIAAEDDGRKHMWRRRAEQRRHEWRERWLNSKGAPPREVGEEKVEDLGSLGGRKEGRKGRSPLTDFIGSLKKQANWAQRTVATGARLVEHSEASAAETRMFDSVEFMVGHFAVRSFEVNINQHRYALAADGWELYGFVGTETELKNQLFYVNEGELKRHLLLGRAVQIGLVAKLLKDSGSRVVQDMIRDLTGKDEYEVGDLSRAAIRKISKDISSGVSEFTGKDTYQFGDISRKISKDISSGVSEFTGKDKYQFGDISRKISNDISSGMSDFTGKEEYQFGDISRKISKEIASGVSDFTGKDEYHFGDISRAAVAKMGGIFAKCDKSHGRKCRSELSINQIDSSSGQSVERFVDLSPSDGPTDSKC